jgi:hypothetical protein
MSTIKANTLLHSDGTTTTEPSIPALDQRMAKAWVNYSGDTMVIRDSYNVSGLTDNGVGDYVVNFTTNMANANYSVSGMGMGAGYNSSYLTLEDVLSVSSVPIRNMDVDGNRVDSSYVMVQIHGGQA